MTKEIKYKTIGNPKGRGFRNKGVPATHVGLILDGRTIEVPVKPPHCEEGQVTTEYAFWSTLQAERRGFQFGFIVGLGISIVFILVVSFLFF